MREANAMKRKTIPVPLPTINGSVLSGAENDLVFPRGWLVLVSVVSGNLGRLVVSPSGQSVSVVVSDDPVLVGKLPADYSEGWFGFPVHCQASPPTSRNL